MAAWRDTFSSARIMVCSLMPYYTEAVMRLRVMEMPGIGTMGVDVGWRIAVDPAVVEKWGVTGSAAVIAHEIEHLIRDHNGRCGTRDHKQFNIAGDMEINDNVRAAGWKLPEEAIFAAAIGAPDNLTAEEYYDLLSKQQGQGGQGKPGKGGGKGQPGSGQPEQSQGQGEGGQSDGSGQQADGQEQGQGQSGQGKGDPDPAPGNGWCGSCAANPQSWEKDGDPAPDVEKADGGEQEILRRRTAQAIKHQINEKGRGTVPASLVRWADDMLTPPKVDWKKQMRTAIRNAVASKSGSDVRTWRRLSSRYHARRAVHGDSVIPMPSYYSPVPKVMIVLDVSGSMTMNNHQGVNRLDAALAEIMGVVRAAGVAVQVCAVDAAVQCLQKVRSKKHVIEAASRGFGGTDMRIGISACLEHRPDVLIVLSDGETPWPSASDMPQKTRLVAAIVTDEPVPEWIKHVVRVED